MLYPVIFYIVDQQVDQQVLGEKRCRRARPEEAFTLLAWPDHEYWDTLLVWDTPSLGALLKHVRAKSSLSLSLCRRILNSKHLIKLYNFG